MLRRRISLALVAQDAVTVLLPVIVESSALEQSSALVHPMSGQLTVVMARDGRLCESL